MKTYAAILALAVFFAVAAKALPPQQAASSQQTPAWAFAVNPPGDLPAKDDGTLKSVPGSSKALTLSQVRDSFNIPDWHPEDHPSMPVPVQHGRNPEMRACGYCHLPNGLGRPENASVAGLPATYIEQQIADFRSGTRKSSEPKMGPPAAMIDIAKAANNDDVKAAAEYFANLKLKPWIRVVEASTVPKTRVSGSMLIRAEGGGTEPIGERIIETPEDLTRTELRDAASGFIAYVPPGSIKKGEALVTTGLRGKTVQCGLCHGADLRGLGPVPPLAGRSPSYIFRQLYDLKHGVRKGAWSALMAAPLSNLSEADMLNIAAYTASRTP